ncbi:hypothetical protein [Streptomyces clavifer]|uniref:hypothetical protein n=1 Tax=Streptomyces clavifer TaxID=68188 RepID=UPI0036B1E3FC
MNRWLGRAYGKIGITAVLIVGRQKEFAELSAAQPVRLVTNASMWVTLRAVV